MTIIGYTMGAAAVALIIYAIAPTWSDRALLAGFALIMPHFCKDEEDAARSYTTLSRQGGRVKVFELVELDIKIQLTRS